MRNIKFLLVLLSVALLATFVIGGGYYLINGAFLHAAVLGIVVALPAPMLYQMFKKMKVFKKMKKE